MLVNLEGMKMKKPINEPFSPIGPSARGLTWALIFNFIMVAVILWAVGI